MNEFDFDRRSEGYDRCYTCGNRAYYGTCPRCDLGETEPHVVSEVTKRIMAEVRESINETQRKAAELQRAWLECKAPEERLTALRALYPKRGL